MSEPGAGSDLAGLRTTAVRDGDDFVVNGQKVWTSGAHDSDVVLTFVRTDPEAPKHKGISVLLIPTATPGVECRPFAYVYDRDHLDFNEVFFTDARVPAAEPGRRPRRRLAGGQRIAGPRTHHALDEFRRPAARPGPRHPSRNRARSGPLRHPGDGRPGPAPARFGGAGPRIARRGRRRRVVGPEGAGVRGRADRDRTRAGRRRRGWARSIRRPPPLQRATGWTIRREVGSPATREASRAPSRAAHRKSSATSSPSECWGCPGAEAESTTGVGSQIGRAYEIRLVETSSHDGAGRHVVA